MKPRRTLAQVSLVLLGWSVAACGSRPDPGAPSRDPASTASGSEQTAVETRTDAQANARTLSPARPAGPPTRSEAQAIVTHGIGFFLARMQLEPVLDGGRFVGFRLVSAEDLAIWQAAGVDVKPGDVILRFNGIRIERPEQALWAFERLRITPAIEVEVLRDGQRYTARCPIVDDPHRTE